MDTQTLNDVCLLLSIFWGWLVNFLNSNFSAAFFGALAAYMLSQRSKVHDDKALEIRSCNAGVMAAWSICNAALNARKQYIGALHERFQNDKARLDGHRNAIKLKKVPARQVFHFVADYRKLPTMSFDKVAIRRACDKVSLSGKSIMIGDALQRSMDQLNLLISEYNELIRKFEESSEISDAKKVARHFGFQHGDSADSRYADIIAGLAAITDDCVWFSATIAKAFTARGKEIKGKSKNLPKVHSIEFPNKEIPADKSYGDFLA
jgi:hypothetical protein